MAELTSYSQPLRAVGQALERLHMERFDMETDGKNFFVRGCVVVAPENPPESPPQERRLGRLLGFAVKQMKQPAMRPKVNAAPTVTELDLCYTWQDIDRLEQEGQQRRRDGEGAADAGSLSQVLRTVGAYVNHKGARLIKLSRNPAELSITYETASGPQIVEVLAPSALYDFWVRMYLKRSARGRRLNREALERV
jgi:hypothetical protein